MTSPVPDAPRAYRDVWGRRVECQFIAKEDEVPVPGSPVRERLLVAENLIGQPPWQVVQRRLTAAQGRTEWAESDLLDNEVRIGVQLARTLGEDDYPAELSRLIGFDLDAEEPFLLLLPYRGVPAEQVVGRLRIDQERQFQASLFRALRYLEISGVVHGRISPLTVWWNDAGHASTVQVTDFGHAVLAGEPRRRGGRRPWVSPEQFAGSTPAVPADDTWSAGYLVYHVSTGHPVHAHGGPPDLAIRGAAMQTLLTDTFAATAAGRPGSTQLLARLKLPDPWQHGAGTVDHDFEAGLDAFDDALNRKYPGRQPPAAAAEQADVTEPASPPRSKPDQRGKSTSLSGCLTAAGAIALILIGIIVLVVKGII